MADFPDVLETIGHVAVGIKCNDRISRAPPKAAVATVPQTPVPSKNPSRSNSRTSTHNSKVRSWDCGNSGYVQRDCTKWSGGAAAAVPGPTACIAAMENTTQSSTRVETDSGDVPFTSLNVFHGSSVHGGWIIDSGASVHVVNDMSLLHNPLSLSLLGHFTWLPQIPQVVL
jgi:hypothetical protein